MPLLKIRESPLKVMECPRQLHHKNVVHSQRSVPRVQTTELEFDKSVEKNANMKRRECLIDRLEKRTVPPLIKMIDPVPLIREDRER